MRCHSITALVLALLSPLVAADSFTVHPRSRVEVEEDSGRFHAVTRTAEWEPTRTAVIVVDMWDSHHCRNAVLRVGEMAPRMNAFLKTARAAGATIVHAPSSCTGAYADHPARRNVAKVPRSKSLPKDIGKWCYVIPSEEAGEYPIDQGDGGEDDDPLEHAKWAASLLDAGRNPRHPWQRQVDALDIAESDYLTDDGEEVWSLLEHRGIEHVMILGVHTNMCVLGRPFGLRRMAENDVEVVLVRDLTDTMYNPNRKPYVSHFTGTDRIVEHIEKYVCPTILSTDLLGGEEFRFEKDTRPHLVMLMAEREYGTKETLPAFAAKRLGHAFRVTEVHASPKDRNDVPGIDAIASADVLLLSVRRRALPTKHLRLVREHVTAGRPVVAIRTSSHAFALRNGEPPAGHDVWPEFDRDVLGGNYNGHHGNGPEVTVTANAKDHPVLTGIDPAALVGYGSLYRTGPLTKSTTTLLTGTIPGQPPEPLAWVNAPKGGGRVFYTPLGAVKDFEQPEFEQLLYNALHWAAELDVPADLSAPPAATRVKTAPVTGQVTLNGEPLTGAVLEFVPTNGEHSAAGWTDDKGNYHLRTFARGDGAPPGTYSVRIRRTLEGRELIPARYNEKTALVVETREGKNELNFELAK